MKYIWLAVKTGMKLAQMNNFNILKQQIVKVHKLKLRLATGLHLQRKRLPPQVCLIVSNQVSIRLPTKEVQMIILLSFYILYFIILN
jgi:hypothetical protein